MLMTFILIGWIDGSQSGGVLNTEFSSLESCEKAKTMYIERNQIDVYKPLEDRWKYESWVACVKK